MIKNQSLLKNFIFLFFLQGLNYILPLLTIPFLIHNLGIEKFGLLSFSTALITYFVILSDYGFNLSATKEIALNQSNNEKISEIFSTVLFLKFILTVIGFIILNLIIISSDFFTRYWFIHELNFLYVIGQMLFPIWLFQGLECMKQIAIINAIFKILLTVSIFLFIKEKSNFWLVPFLTGFYSILAGLFSLIFIYHKFKISFHVKNIKNPMHYLKDSWYFFISNLGVNLYLNSGTLILGLLTNNIIVGNYAIAEKIMLALRGVVGIIFQVTYPRACKTHKLSLISFFKKIFIPIGIILFFLCLFIFIFSDKLILLISSSNIIASDASFMLKILSFIPFIVALNIPAYQMLLILNLKKSYTIILTFGSLINITLNFLIGAILQGYGIALALIVTEVFITTSLYLSLIFNLKIRNKLNV